MTHRKASDDLKELVHGSSSEFITLEDTLSALHEKGFGLLMLFLVLPNCVPVPIPPGGSTILSLPLLLLSLQMVWGLEHPWLPSWLRKQKLARKTAVKILHKTMPYLHRIERILRYRIPFFAHTRAGERLVGVFWLIFAGAIAIPLPATNFVPGVGILIMSLGLLNKDGVAILIGMSVGIVGCTIAGFVLYTGAQFLSLLW